MSKRKIYAHGSYIGNTGYNQHTRDFFRSLSNHCEIKFRNFTIGTTWEGYNKTPHDKEPYINDIDKKILYEQILWDNVEEKKRSNYLIYPDPSKDFFPDVNIVLCETNHHIFYDDYVGPKIAYNVWESTRQPEDFFKKLLEFDELWVPSKWQRECTIAQGYPPEKIKVVPEGVDSNVFFPDSNVKHSTTSDGRFKFFLAGRWDYRKSIKEIIETFLKTFSIDESVDLIVSVDNPFSNDELETTEQRLKHYGLEDDRIKILHFPSRTDYIDILKSCNVFVSCARSEGWNLPLIESMACGTPSIYSNCSGQLEFAEGKGLPVKILKELPTDQSSYNHFNESVGNYYEPDFEDLSRVMRYAFENYEIIKQNSLKESEEIRIKFSWDNIALLGFHTLETFLESYKQKESTLPKNRIMISYLDGPRVEIIGEKPEKYKIEFINSETSETIFSDIINNNMWTACAKKYYVKWKIKINGQVYDELNLENKRVLISLESKSIGDTIAWVPYAVEFQKKHKCKVIVSSFQNHFFKGLEAYKDVEFIDPGKSTECYALYRLGWFKKTNKWDDFDRYPNQVNLIPLQQTATDILGLEFKEINYGINFEKKERPIEKKYIAFGPNATAGCKEWDYKNWCELSSMILEKGFEVVTLTKNPYFIPNCINVWEEPLSTVSNYLYHADAFVGLGSGLSWLNWALGKHTHMINGFAKDGHEFTSNLTRIYNKDTCIYCWNDEVFVFNPGDWNWCPVYKGTNKQHICQKSITPKQVFESLNL